MKKTLLSLSLMAATTALFAAEIPANKFDEIKAKSTILQNGSITIKKADQVSQNLVNLKLGIQYQTQQGVQERPAQGFLATVDGKTYTFLGGAYDQAGEKVSFAVDTKVVDEGSLWSFGSGAEKLYAVTNPSCPWCQKFETAANADAEFLKKYQINVILMPFNANANEKSYWVLAGKDKAERAARYKALMVDNSTEWQKFTPTPEQKAAFDKEINKSLEAAKELEAEGTPAVFGKDLQPVNWTTLLKM